jgi:hypothetical protein
VTNARNLSIESRDVTAPQAMIFGEVGQLRDY